VALLGIEYCANLVRTRSMVRIDRDIYSMTDFKRKTAPFLSRLRKTGNPIVLTVNGRSAVVIQSAAGYQRLLDQIQHLERAVLEKQIAVCT